MKKSKLSPAQVRVLKALAEPDEYAHYMSYMGSFRPNPYWILHKVWDRIRYSTMNSLEKHGFINITKDVIGQADKARITPAGREYLASLEEAPDEKA